MIEGRVMKVPGAVKPVALADGATVADALLAANMTVGEGEKVSVDGVSNATTSTVLEDDFRVVIAKGAKGNK